MKFTKRMKSAFMRNMDIVLPLLPKNLRYLEIGVFEGASACYVLKNAPEATAVVIDPWASYDGKRDPKVVEEMARANLAEFGDRVKVCKGYSSEILRDWKFYYSSGWDFSLFDLVQVDGGHDEACAADDCERTWPMLKVDGIVCFDDYKSREWPGVRKAVDKFLEGKSVEVLMTNKQKIVRKLA